MQIGSAVMAQGALVDYQRAAVFQSARTLVSQTQVEPNWIARGDRFWFVSTHGQVKSFVLVDPVKNTQQPAFDHLRLAAALSSASGKTYTAAALPFDAFEYQEGLGAIAFTVAQSGWRCELEEYVCSAMLQSVGARAGEVLSPDRHWAVSRRDHNLWVRDTSNGEERALTVDGAIDLDYGANVDKAVFSSVTDRLTNARRAPEVQFSADSRKLFTYRLDLRNLEQLSLVQSVNGARPQAHSYRYPIAGDPQTLQAKLFIFDLREKTATPVRHPDLAPMSVFGLSAHWNESGTRLCFIEEVRGYRRERLNVVDASSGEVRTVLEERSDTYIDYDSLARVLGNGRDLIWSSERDGWKHLYRIDGRTGAVLGQLTRGAWVVRDIAYVNEGRGYVYFTAGGREAGQDPYYRQLYRVKLDGTGIKRLTPEHADHEIAFSPTGRYFIDTHSRIDTAPVSVLRAQDGRLIRELQRADLAPLRAAGFRIPEPFTVKARDGRTDVYGVIYRPSNFDPRRRYAVLDSIYPGPQSSRTPKAFSVTSMESDLALAELGFIVVAIDGMGTPLRSRAFREASYGNLGIAGGLEDHIAGLQQLAIRYPYLDLTRVGIFGHSGGGYASARAILKFPEFYKVAVSSAGNHDQRSYLAEWGERYQGYPVGENFVSQANASLAGNLKGKLLLVHGDLDDNVHPSNTLQLADALIEANKDFDLLIMPNRNHVLINLGKGEAASRRTDPYFLRKRWDYFVEHLLGVTPPREFQLELK